MNFLSESKPLFIQIPKFNCDFMKNKNNVLADVAKSALVNLSNEMGFYFYTDFNRPLGVFARSLQEFISALKRVDIKSIEFHAKRKDFSNWISNTLKDKYLATNLTNMSNLHGEELRKKIIETVESRYNNLAKALSH